MLCVLIKLQFICYDRCFKISECQYLFI